MTNRFDFVVGLGSHPNQGSCPRWENRGCIRSIEQLIWWLLRCKGNWILFRVSKQGTTTWSSTVVRNWLGLGRQSIQVHHFFYIINLRKKGGEWKWNYKGKDRLLVIVDPHSHRWRMFIGWNLSFKKRAFATWCQDRIWNALVSWLGAYGYFEYIFLSRSYVSIITYRRL